MTIGGFSINVVDLCVGIVLLLGLLRGLRVGFIHLILGLTGFVLGFWGAATWSTALVQASERYFRAVTATSSIIRRYIEIPADVALMSMKSFSVSEIMNRVLSLPLHSDLKAAIGRYLTSLINNMNTVNTSTVGDFLYKAFASLILHAVAFMLILYTIRGIAVVMANVLGTSFARDGSGAVTNRLMGGLLGVTQSAVTLVAIIGLISPLVNLSGNANLVRLFGASVIVPALSKTFMWAVATFGHGL